MRSWEDYKNTMRSGNPIFEFARSGDTDALRLVVSDENLNVQDAQGYSPLMLAAYHGHYETAKFLLELSADPDTKDFGGNTVLMGASFKGHLEIVKLLIRYGADPLAVNNKNQTALQFARMFGRKEVAEHLDATKRFEMTDQVSSWLTYVFKKRGK